MRSWISAAALLGLALVVGCNANTGTGTDKDKKGGTGPSASGKKPTFSLAWSEYPSWSVFGVAAEKGLLDEKEGKLGKLEEKWGVDIKLDLLEYEPCINAFQAKNCDAVCITNLDVLNPSLTRNSVAIVPTSTSVGADALITTSAKDIEGLRGQKVYGLPKSVSEYVFVRNLELLGEKEGDFKFTQMDPGDAAKAMQAKSKEVVNIMVWNPFVLQTLKTRPEAKVIFDSSKIPEEIIDMVVVGEDVLKKPGGKEFACAVIDIYYEFNKMLADPKQRDDLLVDLGKKFSSLDKTEMEKAVTQTRFYKTPEEALKLFEGEKFRKTTMPNMVKFCMDHKIIEKGEPKVDFGDKAGSNLRFDPTYIKMVQEKDKK